MQAGLSLRVSQHLALTPQLQQSIRLLQLSTLEMEQEVEHMLGDNPFLERDEADSSNDSTSNDSAQPPTSTPDSRAEEPLDAIDSGAASADQERAGAEFDAIPTDWEGEGSFDDADGPGGGTDGPESLLARSSASAPGDDGSEAFERVAQHESLAEHLHRQALALRLGPADRAALYFLIESLTDDGYLPDPLPSLAEHLCESTDPEEREQVLHHLQVALGLLQHLEPAGVGARDLAQCLVLQLRALARAGEVHDPAVLQVAQRVCSQPLELLARRDLRKLAQLCHGTSEQVRQALALIVRLEPHPGRSFVDVQRQTLVPDVIVQPRGSGWSVQINPEVMPRLRIHEAYANALRGQRGSAGGPALQARLQEARWFIKNIQQRFDTILRVSKAIVQRQKNFFVHGALAMRPLVLREIADELGLHESTISRVTSAKYMATPQGTYELKYFFGSGLGTDTGGNASSTAVRALIRQLIEAESPRKPLSDNRIAELLKEQGIECARRTVAKYREALKIAPAHLRKEH